MPRNAVGLYSLPIGAFLPGGLIKSSDMNSNFSDIAAALTGSLPTNGAAGMTGPLKLADGTLAAPGLAFTSDATTGFYRAGAGTFTWVASGAAAGVFASTGLTVNGTLNVVGNTTLSNLTLLGGFATSNASLTGTVTMSGLISSGTAGLSVALSVPLAPGYGGTPLYIGQGATTGSANAQVLAATTPNNFALTAGLLLAWLPGYTNLASMSLSVTSVINSTGSATSIATTSVYKQATSGYGGAQPLAGGEVVAGQWALGIYDGTRIQLLNPPAVPGFGALTNLASAATTDLGTIPSHFINITGGINITSFGSSANTDAPLYMIRFAATTLLTYNGVSLITPNSLNITAYSGDNALAQYLGGGNWRIVSFTRFNPSNFSVQSFTSPGTSGNVSPTQGATRWEFVLVGSGGGGTGVASGSATYASGTAVGPTSLGSWTVISGSPGTGATNMGAGGTGGINGTGVLVERIAGAPGVAGSVALNPGIGAAGGNSMKGFGATTVYGNSLAGNSASGGYGGGGGGAVNPTTSAGAGGGGGEVVCGVILAPATMSYVIATASPGGISSYSGGNATGGGIWIKEYFN